MRPATPAVKSSALGNAADKKNTPKDIYVAQKSSGRRETQRLNAAALEEELKTNTPYWYDNRIHSFGNVGFGGVFASVCAPLATWAIDQAAYEGRDVRTEACATAAAAIAERRSRATPACAAAFDVEDCVEIITSTPSTRRTRLTG